MLNLRLVRLFKKWSLGLSVVPIVAIAAILKYIYHQYGLEVLPSGSFMSGLIAANVFLLGFLISGVLVDYKESEKLPGELAANFAVIFDEVSMIYKNAKVQAVRDCLDHTRRLITSVRDWFYKVEHTDDLMEKISKLNDHLSAVAPLTDANAIARIKDQRDAIRRTVIRVRTIRGTFFVPSGYAIAEATNVLVIVGLLATQISTFLEAVFFIGFITFLNTYMLMLIKQLDNPFDYYSRQRGVDEISLLPLDETARRIEMLVKTLGSQEELDVPSARVIPEAVAAAS